MTPCRIFCAVLFAVAFATSAPALAAASGHIVVDARDAGIVNAFDPLRTIGAGVDSQSNGAVATIYAKPDVEAMLATGLGPVSYRLYTELSVQQWHWNPAGAWSDAAGQGYWTGSTALGRPVTDSYGYRLPHRGFTNDQGNNDDYSRLDDGDAASYWKSDPYLTSAYTKEPDAAHPQWALVDLGARVPVDGVRLQWSEPYATDYVVQYWRGGDAINNPAQGAWVAFPRGTIAHGTGGDVTLRLDATPRSVRYLRVLMSRSSNTCDSHGPTDPRNCVGFAMNEIGAGTLDPAGTLHDLVTHRPDNRQTQTFVSSVDPWHAPANRVKDQEQPGLDIVYRSGITRDKPAMLPVSMLYGTPDDAAAEIRYVEARGYPISYVELGEEPDGQYVEPEDHAALYIQWATALHAVDPALKLGGPVFQGVTSDVQTWPDKHGNVSWLKRFLGYLAAHGHAADLSFMSFEHYPFGACGGSEQQNLLDEAALVRGVVRTWHADGIPNATPMFITEMNYAADFNPVPQEVGGALWFADVVGSFLAAGGKGLYLYEYEPTPLFRAGGCNIFGALNPFDADQSYRVRQPAAEFFAANVMMQAWALPIDAEHVQYAASSDVLAKDGKPYLTPYVLLRPDGTWAVLVVNNDLANAHDATIDFTRARGAAHFAGSVTATTFGPAQYVWHPNGPNGMASPDGPAAVTTVRGGAGERYTFPAASLTVLAGTVR